MQTRLLVQNGSESAKIQHVVVRQINLKNLFFPLMIITCKAGKSQLSILCPKQCLIASSFLRLMAWCSRALSLLLGFAFASLL